MRNNLHPHIERLVQKHAGKEPHARSAMRGLLAYATHDEPLRLSQRDFLDELERRWIADGRNRKTAVLYKTRARQAMGIANGRGRNA